MIILGVFRSMGARSAGCFALSGVLDLGRPVIRTCSVVSSAPPADLPEERPHATGMSLGLQAVIDHCFEERGRVRLVVGRGRTRPRAGSIRHEAVAAPRMIGTCTLPRRTARPPGRSERPEGASYPSRRAARRRVAQCHPTPSVRSTLPARSSPWLVASRRTSRQATPRRPSAWMVVPVAVHGASSSRRTSTRRMACRICRPRCPGMTPIPVSNAIRSR